MSSTDFKIIHEGVKSDQARALQAAHNRRVHARGLDSYKIDEDGVLSGTDLLAVRKCAWILGALEGTYSEITSKHEVSIGAQRMIRNPGLRSDEQLKRARARVSQLRALQHTRAVEAKEEQEKMAHRLRLCSLAELAAAHYRADPSAYHYLAGGMANLIFLAPSPLGDRSDCSQFYASVFNAAGLPSPANVSALYASTFSIAPHGVLTTTPKMGDAGMYGTRDAPHHIEMYIGKPGEMFIGHGSPPIDSLTPGYPDYFLTFPFLDTVGLVDRTDGLFSAASMDLRGEQSRFEQASTQGIVSRDFLPEVAAAGLATGFSGEAASLDDQTEVDYDVTRSQIASL